MEIKVKDLKRAYVLQGRQLQVKDFSLSYKSEQIDQFFVAFAEARTKQLTGEMSDCYNNSWLQFSEKFALMFQLYRHFSEIAPLYVARSPGARE